MSYNQDKSHLDSKPLGAPPPYSNAPTSHLAPGDDKHLYDPERDGGSRSNSPLAPVTPRRGSHESSAGESDYDPEIKPFMSTTNTFRIYDILNTKSHINARIVDASTRQPVYYVDNSSFTPGKPDVTLCRGVDKTDPVVGTARWSHMYSKHLNVSLGDQTSTEVASGSRHHPEWKWSVTGADGQRHTFAWSRLHGQDAMDAGGNKVSSKNFKLVYLADATQTGNGDVLATFASNRLKSWSKLGKVIVSVDGAGKGWGTDWEVLVLLSVLGLVEMSRRRSRSRRGNAGGGGGS